MSEEINLINKKSVKELVNSKDFKVSGDFFEAFNSEVKKAALKAVKRAESNKRKTVYGYDC